MTPDASHPPPPRFEPRRPRTAPRPENAIGLTRIYHQRVKRGWTQKQAAEAAGLSLRTYRALERDEIFDPGIRQLSNLAHAFGCTIEELAESHWLQPTDFTQSRRSRRNW